MSALRFLFTLFFECYTKIVGCKKFEIWYNGVFPLTQIYLEGVRMQYPISFTKDPWLTKIESGDSENWKKLNGSFINGHYDRSEIMDYIYRGHAFAPCFRNGWRHSSNYLLAQHIGLDFDKGDVGIDRLAENGFIASNAAVMYSTPSHSKAQPKTRVLFLLDQPIHQGENYKYVVKALMSMLSLPYDKACKDCARFFYGSKDCDIWTADNVLSLGMLKERAIELRKAEEWERLNRQRDYTPQSATEEDIQEALKVIDPMAIGYDEWLMILMAIHHELGDAGLPMAEAWGAGSEGEIAKKWRGFKSSGTVTIGSLFYMAAERGYQRGGQRARVKPKKHEEVAVCVDKATQHIYNAQALEGASFAMICHSEKDVEAMREIGYGCVSHPKGAHGWANGSGAKLAEMNEVYIVSASTKDSLDESRNILQYVPRAQVIRLPSGYSSVSDFAKQDRAAWDFIQETWA